MNHHPQEHERQPHPHWKPLNGQFVATLGKYIISFLCGALVAAYTVGFKSSKLDDLLTWKGEATVQIKKMDDEGTRASRNALQNEAKELARYEERIKKIEDAVEKIGTMSYKIDELAAEVRSQKK